MAAWAQNASTMPTQNTANEQTMERASLLRRFRRRCGCGGLRRCCCSYANYVARCQCFRRIIDNSIGRRQARHDLHAVAEIAAQLHLLEDDLVITVESSDLRALIPGHKRPGWTCKYISIFPTFEMHIAVTAGEKLAGRVISLKQKLPRFSRPIQCLRNVSQRCVELRSRVLRH